MSTINILAASWYGSPWWLVCLAVPFLVWLVFFVALRGKRLSVLSVGSVVAACVLLVTWTASFWVALSADLNLNEVKADHINYYRDSLRLNCGDIEFAATKWHDSSPDRAKRAAWRVPQYHRSEFKVDTNWPKNGSLLLSAPNTSAILWWKHLIGIHWESRAVPPGKGDVEYGLLVIFKIWFLLPLILLFPTLWLFRKRRDGRRRLANRCIRCNYDLRGSSGKCPECGREIMRAEGAGGVRTPVDGG
jgi:hypothetical protein